MRLSVLCLLIVFSIWAEVTADSDYIPRPCDCRITPEEPILAAGDASLLFTLRRNEGFEKCGFLRVSVETENGLILRGPSSWSIQLEVDEVYETTIPITIPEGDTSAIKLTVGAPEGGCRSHRALYFSTLHDTVLVSSDRRIYGSRGRSARPSDQYRKWLSAEQMQTQIDILIYWHMLFPRQREFVDSLLGGKLVPTSQEDVYVARTTIETLCLLVDRRMAVTTRDATLTSLLKSYPDHPLNHPPQDSAAADPGR